MFNNFFAFRRDQARSRLVTSGARDALFFNYHPPPAQTRETDHEEVSTCLPSIVLFAFSRLFLNLFDPFLSSSPALKTPTNKTDAGKPRSANRSKTPSLARLTPTKSNETYSLDSVVNDLKSGKIKNIVVLSGAGKSSIDSKQNETVGPQANKLPRCQKEFQRRAE